MVSLTADFLPSPPRSPHIVSGSVTSSQVVVAWDVPEDFTKGQVFLVAWKQTGTDAFQWESVSYG